MEYNTVDKTDEETRVLKVEKNSLEVLTVKGKTHTERYVIGSPFFCFVNHSKECPSVLIGVCVKKLCLRE